jgi:hypothetical protein
LFAEEKRESYKTQREEDVSTKQIEKENVPSDKLKRQTFLLRAFIVSPVIDIQGKKDASAL